MKSYKGFVIPAILGVLALCILVAVIVPMLYSIQNQGDVDVARNLLNSNGYIVLAAGATVPESLIPSATATYDLGSITALWKQLFVRDIYLYDLNTWLSRDGLGNLIFNDSVTGTKTLAQLAASSSSSNFTSSGTVGYIPQFVTSNNVTNSIMVGNASNVTVNGAIIATQGVTSNTLQVGSATPIFPIYSGSGFMSQLQVDGTAILRSADWGVSQLNYGDSATIPEHTGTGSYDYTGNTTAERLFFSTASIFDAADANGNMLILLSGAHVGSVVEIEHYLSPTQVQVTSDNGWTSDLTNETFGILPTPTFGIANSGSARFAMGGESTLVMRSLAATSAAPVNVQVVNGDNDVSAFEVDVLNGGYSNNEAIDVVFNTGAMPADSRASIVKITGDKSSATTSTNTTEIDYINIEQVGKNDALSDAIHVGQGFDTALIVSGGSRIDPLYGYTVTAANTATDRIAAFTNVSSNVQMFTADDSYILLGSNATFEAVPVFLSIVASSTITPTYQYSTGNGTWGTLVVSDSTSGFTTNGILTFNAPVAWAQTSLVVPAGNAITTGYYVKVVRTRNSLTTPPTESYFKIYTSSSLTNFQIRGNGTVSLVSMADAAASNNSLYYSMTQNKIAFKDLSGTVRTFY